MFRFSLGAGHYSQGNVWHKIEDDDCNLVDTEKLKIRLPYPGVVHIEHFGVHLTRPISDGHYFNDSNDHEAEIDDGTPAEEFTNHLNAHGCLVVRHQLCVYSKRLSCYRVVI